ncbi:niban-like protein 1 [Salarias fasciatus]|uniref:Niban-like protein 1 n=1 Tax=Salarias fasciatus TaxID=181472 RepID=A0A672FGK0_SALFA|nr:niban-like protein 1 [Salarias fasciatus]
MGDVVSSHLDEAKREMITARTAEVMGEFGRLYERHYSLALFNKVRFDIEGGGGPQPQLLHRKVPLENKSIFSGTLFQFLEENKKLRNRFVFIPDSYNINYYENKSAHDRNLQPKGTINCAGYKVLTSVDQYVDLISSTLPGLKAKGGSSPFQKVVVPHPLILWHPFARHYFFALSSEKEQQKWQAVLQDCVRHANDGLSEDHKVQTPAFTDAVRLYRQAQGHYGTWEMMCGVPSQILSNLVMESLLPELRDLISPRLKGKLRDRQRNWMLISDAVYSLVHGQCQDQYEAVLQRCEAARSSLEASIRKDMDQIITSKEHVTNKIRAVVLPKAEKLLKVSIQPYIGSILEALMEPTSRGFFEVRDVFFRELVDMSKNTINEGTKETVAQHMEKISMLAFHPVKMQSCYEKVEQLSLEGLQQRFDVCSPSVFVQRAQILMREQMDDAVYTFEQILHQSLDSQGSEDLCKTIQRCQDRVIKKFDYDSSTVRKRFFREALLQIFIPYMLKQLSPSCASELPRFRELIFEDFSRFILVESIFEEVVLHSVMKDIMMAVKEAAIQRKHNLYRDSIVLGNSDPSLQLLGENPSIDWAGEYGGAAEDGEDEESQKKRRMKQVVSMIQVEDATVLPAESCMEVPGVDDIQEEEEEEEDDDEASGGPEAAPAPLVGMSNGSVVKEEPKPQENVQEQVVVDGPVKLEGKHDKDNHQVAVEKETDSQQVRDKADTKVEDSQQVEPETKVEDSQQVEDQPLSNQEEPSEEVLPPPPPPEEPISDEITEPASEATNDLPPPPHQDGSFQPSSAEAVEVQPEVEEVVKKEVQPEVEEEVKKEVQPEVEEEVKKEVQPEVEEEVKKEVQPEVEEEVKKEVQPEVEEEVKKEVQPEVEEEVKKEVQPEVEEEVKKEVQPEVEEEVKKEVQPEVEEEVKKEVQQQQQQPPPSASSQPSEEQVVLNVAAEPKMSDSEIQDQ